MPKSRWFAALACGMCALMMSNVVAAKVLLAKDEALAKGMGLVKELKSNETLKKLRECSEGLTEMMEGMPWAQMNPMKGLDDTEEPTNDDICS